ncbi:BTB/POZ domain-containing-like protein [Cinnamomum micranthum f. kanehirae]|uniref:BTB/POZ domain-containing-like protein n=1 Tax=Cinnamomum micranthum f. kanehirae TaxID=337451 RepID=A0A443NBV1_9MAGN|nr:BTB/POZ domain-containing-like protein [Cinnamomum micranthum f. kanehirae]
MEGTINSSLGLPIATILHARAAVENNKLKLEVARMRMRLTGLEKNLIVSMKHELVRSTPVNKLSRSFGNKLSKLSSFLRIKDGKFLNGKFKSKSQFLCTS